MMFVVIGVAFEAKIISLPKLGSVRREKVSWNQNMLHQSLAPAVRDLVGPSGDNQKIHSNRLQSAAPLLVTFDDLLI